VDNLKRIRKPTTENIAASTALRMALHCVRNTIIEDYHAAGKLTDREMKVFNKAVADKLYTFLLFSTHPKYLDIQDLLFKSNNGFTPLLYVPVNWDMPQLDQNFLKAVRSAKKRRSKIEAHIFKDGLKD